MLPLSDNQLVTSPSFLQSVLAGSVEAELSDLHAEVKQFEKNIQLLSVEVHEDITGRYITFEKFEHCESDYLPNAQKCLEELESITSRIADSQVKTDVKNSVQELLNMQDDLKKTKSMLSIIYQLLNIDCALQSVKKAAKVPKYLEAAQFYSKIPPMFDEYSENTLYADLSEVLKKECRIQCRHLLFELTRLWSKTLTWNTTDQSLSCKTKSVSLKILKNNEMYAVHLLECLYYVGTLESTLSTLGSSLLNLVLTPILTSLTTVIVKESKEHTLLSIEISLSKDKPSLTMIAANLKIVFDFINEQINMNLGPSGTCLSILGAFISNDFSKVLLKECLITSSIKDQEQDFTQGLEELNEFVEYISFTGFLHSDNVTKNVTKLMKFSVDNPAFWKRANYLERARDILKKDINETFLLEENSYSHLLDGIAEGDVVTSIEGSVHASFTFPSCRISKSIVELLKLYREVLTPTEGDTFEQGCHSFETARRIIEMYAAIGPVRCRTVDNPRPLEIALFYNNSMFFAHRLSRMGFDNDADKHSKGRKLVAIDLVQHIRTMAVQCLLQCLKQQRNTIVEKTKGIDLVNLKNSCAELEKTVKECLLLADNLRSSWRHVLPTQVYMKAIGGIVNAWLDELMKIISTSESIPGSIVRDIKVVYKVVADNVPALLEVSSDIGVHVSRWSKFEALIRTRFSIV